MTNVDNNMPKERKEELKPDIVITMNGNSVSGIKSFVKSFKDYVHWDISPRGTIADPFKKITRVFECNAMEFIKRMNYMAGDHIGESTYFESWKKHENTQYKVPEKYSMKYCVHSVIDKMPEKALLHLANSSTIRMASTSPVKKGTEIFCNRGTNGIDGSASAFMGQVAVRDVPCYLLIGDLSFFYDLNSLWNKKLKGNMRIMLFNNHLGYLLKYLDCSSTEHSHAASAEGWVRSLGFEYISSVNKSEFDTNIDRFVSDENVPMFFEVFC